MNDTRYDELFLVWSKSNIYQQALLVIDGGLLYPVAPIMLKHGIHIILVLSGLILVDSKIVCVISNKSDGFHRTKLKMIFFSNSSTYGTILEEMKSYWTSAIHTIQLYYERTTHLI